MNKYIEVINVSLKEDIDKNILDAGIQEAIYYCLNDGKRWRPLLFLSLFETSNISIEKYPILQKCCLSLEYIHNASLVLDDMPMMDNDDYRRNKLTLHKKYNESTSKLAALQLILLAQYHISNIIIELNRMNYFTCKEEFEKIGNILNREIFNNLGNNGLCIGQYLDLSINKKDLDLEKWHSIVYKKTSSLFILSFLLGYILSRKNVEPIEEIKKIGEYFGYIYQILDDIEDYESDLKKNSINILFIINKQQVNDLVLEYYTKMTILINKYNLGCRLLVNILKLLKLKWLKTKQCLNM